MLSTTTGQRVAVVVDGPQRNEKYYVKKDDGPAEVVQDPYDAFQQAESWMENPAKYRFLSRQDQDRLRLAILEQAAAENLPPELKARAAAMRMKLEHANKYHVKLPAGRFCILPTETPERLYIAGRSGSGKSVVTAMYAREYHEMYPTNRILLFSTHDGEHAYETLPMQQVDLDEAFIENPPSVQELADSLVIFDDVDNLQDKKLAKAVNALQADLLANGRKHGIYTCNLNHQLTDYSRTRHLLNEASRVVFFPGGTTYHIARYLKVYAGMNPRQIKRILTTTSRWVCLGLSVPNYVLSEHELYILRDDDPEKALSRPKQPRD